MTAFAAAADLQPLDPGIGTTTADAVLEMVSNGIRAGLGWEVDQHTATHVLKPSRLAVSRIFLPARHVTAATVTVDGEELIEDEDYYLHAERGEVELIYATTKEIQVDYTAGWSVAEIPPIIKSVTIEYALRYAANPSDVASYTMGKTQESFRGSATPRLVIEDDRLTKYSLGPGF